jgi:hypothetical protein
MRVLALKRISAGKQGAARASRRADAAVAPGCPREPLIMRTLTSPATPAHQRRSIRYRNNRSVGITAFTEAADVRSGSQVHIAHSHGELGGAQPGLAAQRQQGVVASPGPGGLVGSGQKP